MTDNPSSNEKKRKANDQQASIELEDFDYFIPQLPSVENILKVIIGKINMINENFDFIT